MKLKKIITIVYIGIMIATFSGCSQKELTDKDFDQIKAGMTRDEVERSLGEPKEIVLDDEEAHSQRYDESQNEDPVDAPQIYYDFAGGEQKDFQLLGEKVRSSDNLSYYHYEYGDDDYENIYFIDDEVVWRTF